VTRFFRGREAVSTCPELILIQVPTSHGKSDMGIYRDYGAKALKLIQETCGAGVVMEKASVDEMYVDLTKPARSALAAAGSYEELLREAAAAGTHVAGAAEGEEEAAMGAQPTGVLARSSFRAGHAGQVVRAIGAASAAWWARTAPEWDEEEMLLAAAAAIVARARAAVTRELGFTCSAGIAANKLLAKLCGGLHKPNQQTILPASAVQALLDPLPIDRLRGFGGKMGSILREGRPELGLSGFSSAGELRRGGVSAAAKLLRGEWAHPDEAAALAVRMASGLDDDAVRERPLAKQVGASKNFSGTRGAARGPLDTRAAIERWLNELAEDIATRLEQQANEHGRHATTLVVMCSLSRETMRSRRAPLREPSALGMAKQGIELLSPLLDGRNPARLGVTYLGLSAEKFETDAAGGDRGALLRLFSSAMTEKRSAGISTKAGRQAEDRCRARERTDLLRFFQPAIAPASCSSVPVSSGLDTDACACNLPTSDCGTDDVVQVGQAACNGHEDVEDGDNKRVPRFLAEDTCDAAYPGSSPSDTRIHAKRKAPLLDEAGSAAVATSRGSSDIDGALAVRWACEACTLCNHQRAILCELCGTLRGSPLSVVAMTSEKGGVEPESCPDAPPRIWSDDFPADRFTGSATGKRAVVDPCIAAAGLKREENTVFTTGVGSGGRACVKDKPGRQVSVDDLCYTQPTTQRSSDESVETSRKTPRLEKVGAMPAHALTESHGAGELEDHWACEACTLSNRQEATRCELCGALRGSALPTAATLSEQGGTDHRLGRGSAVLKIKRPGIGRGAVRLGRGGGRRATGGTVSLGGDVQGPLGTFFRRAQTQ